jgi:hypothetical protein
MSSVWMAGATQKRKAPPRRRWHYVAYGIRLRYAGHPTFIGVRGRTLQPNTIRRRSGAISRPAPAWMAFGRSYQQVRPGQAAGSGRPWRDSAAPYAEGGFWRLRMRDWCPGRALNADSAPGSSRVTPPHASRVYLISFTSWPEPPAQSQSGTCPEWQTPAGRLALPAGRFALPEPAKKGPPRGAAQGHWRVGHEREAPLGAGVRHLPRLPVRASPREP